LPKVVQVVERGSVSQGLVELVAMLPERLARHESAEGIQTTDGQSGADHGALSAGGRAIL
jgi:hypothetical protein